MEPPPLRVYGIVNCDTVKRARAWLAEHAIEHAWIDFRKQPPSPQQLRSWTRTVGWEALLNRRGTTWRALDAATQSAVRDEASAVDLMRQHPTLIRRPIVEHAGDVIVGFDASDYAHRFG